MYGYCVFKFRLTFLESSLFHFYIQGFGLCKNYFSKNVPLVFRCFQHLSTEL